MQAALIVAPAPFCGQLLRAGAALFHAAARLFAAKETSKATAQDDVSARAAQILDAHGNAILRYAYSYLHNMADAEEVLQDTLIQFLKTEPVLATKEHEKAWLIRTTLHRACDMARAAERRNLPLETAEVLPGGEMPEPSPILSAVQALPAKYSAVIHLYYYEGYSIKEISKLLQIPLPTVGTRLSRGRERLRQLLKEDVE